MKFSHADINRASGHRTIYQSLTEIETGFYKSFSSVTYSPGMNEFKGEAVPELPKGVSVVQAMTVLLRNPWRQIVLRWNGKAAMLSAMFRAVIFLLASLKSHHAGRAGGAVAEALYGAISAGFFGTLTQALRFANPQWLADLLLAGIFPLAFQVGDFYFHAALGTQVFRVGMISSAVFTVLSSAFNLYIMRRGTLLVGEEGKSFSQDMGALPRLALMFVVSGVLKVWRFVGGSFREIQQEAVIGESASTDSVVSP
jgi:hypothetical protein